MRHFVASRVLSVTVAAALLAVGGCASSPDRDYGGEGLGSVDGAYYDQPRDFDYAYAPAGGYYYDSYPYYYNRPYYYGGYGGRYRGRDWDRDHDRGHWDHDRGGHDRGDHDGRDHDAPGRGGDHDLPDRPTPATPDRPDKPSYNDMRAGKLNPHIHENAGGDRVTRRNGGTSGSGKH